MGVLLASALGAAVASAQAVRPCSSTETARDPTGQADYLTTTRYLYDGAGREVAEQIVYSRQGIPGEKYGQKSTSWDSAGRMASEASDTPTQHDAISYTYATDAQGRAVKVTRTGRVAGETVSESTDRVYDAQGRISQETLRATTGWTLVTSYTYDAWGHEVERREAEAGNHATTIVRTTWDAQGREIDRTTTLPDGSVEMERWSYDPAGSGAQEQVIRGGQLVKTIAFAYRCG